MDTYGDARKSFNDWNDDFGGDQVSDPTLDFIQRGERRIANSGRWPWMLRRATLTLSDKEVTLSSEQKEAEIIHIFSDPDGSGKRRKFYTEGEDYVVTTTFSRETGMTKKVKFYTDPSATIKMDYQIELPTLTATDAEFLMFSLDLVVKAAQLEYLEEEPADPNEYASIEKAYVERLKQEKRKRIGENQAHRQRINDEEGDEIGTAFSDLDGGSSSPRVEYKLDERDNG
jgi:hypothetical protein